ncbi:class I SAM-dependent methyltransferase [Evansella sp. AB-rgal1]|uniref:class I SAM-dependent methyltransferase n=1 Tax=Evansella sp. AB-rgal1 TaxID=3242696 RepID=UPI00359EBCAE
MGNYMDMLAAYGVTIARPGGKKMTETAFHKFPITKGEILEIGCGLGDTSSFLAKISDAKVTALDNHSKMLEKARKRHNQNPSITWIEGDYQTYETSILYDTVIAESVLSFSSISRGLKKINKLMKDDGTLFMLEPIYLGGLSAEDLVQYKNFYGFKEILTKEKWNEELSDSRFYVKDIIHSYDIENIDKEDLSYPELCIDPNLDKKHVEILEKHIMFTEKYLAFFDYAYFICEKKPSK